jgi:hypothetical protein
MSADKGSAQEALDTLLLPRPPSSSGSSSGSDSDGDANKGAPVPMRSYLKQAEIVVATKTHHMSEISRKMEVEYEEMVRLRVARVFCLVLPKINNNSHPEALL